MIVVNFKRCVESTAILRGIPVSSSVASRRCGSASRALAFWNVASRRVGQTLICILLVVAVGVGLVVVVVVVVAVRKIPKV